MVWGRRGIALVGGIAAALIAAPSALGGGPTPRYAEPGGNGPEPCAEADPCSLQAAVENAPAASVVLLEAGTYIESDKLSIANNVSVAPVELEAGAAVIDSAATTAVEIAPASINTVLRDVTIDHDPTAPDPTTAGLSAGGGIVQRVFVESGTPSVTGCNITGEVLIRDTVCVNTAGNGSGTQLRLTTDAEARLVNVTLIATGASGVGLVVSTTADNADLSLEGENVIARGPLFDVLASAVFPTDSAVVDLSFSNFATTSPGLSPGSSITDPSTQNNQTAAPQLDSRYRQLSGSPTRNAGNNAALGIGPADIDIDDRVQEGTVDIGADEFRLPPTTQITAKPPKKTRKRTARFRFTSKNDDDTFECKLDSRPYKDCDSPKTYRKLKRRKHTFKVRAVNTFGTADPSPARHTWTVKKRRR